MDNHNNRYNNVVLRPGISGVKHSTFIDESNTRKSAKPKKLCLDTERLAKPGRKFKPCM